MVLPVARLPRSSEPERRPANRALARRGYDSTTRRPGPIVGLRGEPTQARCVAPGQMMTQDSDNDQVRDAHEPGVQVSALEHPMVLAALARMASSGAWQRIIDERPCPKISTSPTRSF